MRSSSALARVLSAIVAVGPMITCALDNGLGLTPPMGWNSCELDRELDATQGCNPHRHTLHACKCTRGALTPPLALACCQPATRAVLLHAFWCSIRAGQPMATACSCWFQSVQCLSRQFAASGRPDRSLIALHGMACGQLSRSRRPLIIRAARLMLSTPRSVPSSLLELLKWLHGSKSN
jgi:hypothetical protein